MEELPVILSAQVTIGHRLPNILFWAKVQNPARELIPKLLLKRLGVGIAHNVSNSSANFSPAVFWVELDFCA